ncbi:Tryptophan synthase beta chain [subsurface metagenome]
MGGRFVPETLVPALEELTVAYHRIKEDSAFWEEFNSLSREYSGRPTPLYQAKGLSRYCGGAQIFLKREDLAHTGAHKINNALGQGLLARRMGKRRIIAETGAGQHGVATAAVCAMLGLKCVVYMGEEDVHRQSLNVFRMRLMGAEVRPVVKAASTSVSPQIFTLVIKALSSWLRYPAPTSAPRRLIRHPHPILLASQHRLGLLYHFR